MVLLWLSYSTICFHFSGMVYVFIKFFFLSFYSMVCWNNQIYWLTNSSLFVNYNIISISVRVWAISLSLILVCIYMSSVACTVPNGLSFLLSRAYSYRASLLRSFSIGLIVTSLSLTIYVYIYIRIYMHIHIHHICIYIHMYIHTYIHMYSLHLPKFSSQSSLDALSAGQGTH